LSFENIDIDPAEATIPWYNDTGNCTERRERCCVFTEEGSSPT